MTRAGWRLAVVLLAPVLAGCAPLVTDPAPSSPTASRARGPFLRVVGIAQDGGFPHAACEHEACRAARDGRQPAHLVSSVALVLPESGQVYLFDATPDIRSQLDLLRDVRTPPTDRVDRAPIDGVFLTHAHLGHYLGLAFFGFEAVHTQALPVWATPRMSSYLRSNGPWSQLVEFGNVELRTLEPEGAVTLADGVTVTPFRVPHRDELSDTVGYLISGPRRRVVFVPDTDKWATWRPTLVERLSEVDVALLDGSFYSADELPGRSVEEIGHPMIGATMDLLAGALDDGLEVVFIHLNHSNPALVQGSPARLEVERRGFSVAVEGLEFDL